jgi:hypothetical protein
MRESIIDSLTSADPEAKKELLESSIFSPVGVKDVLISPARSRSSINWSSMSLAVLRGDIWATVSTLALSAINSGPGELNPCATLCATCSYFSSLTFAAENMSTKNAINSVTISP